MKSENVRLMTVAIAVSVSEDTVAFEMLQQDYMDAFMQSYRDKCSAIRKSGSKQIPNMLDEMIRFAIEELTIRCDRCQSLADLMSPVRKAEIIERYLHQTMSQMLTSLAKRDIVRNQVRKNLHAKDRMGVHSTIESNRFDTVFTDFMRMFEESSAVGYQFHGSFLVYVMNTFVQYYYVGNKRDLWNTLYEEDFAKREVETSIGSVTMQESVRTDDILIHDLVENITLLNDLMFKHSGQTSDAMGVSYDAFYMILLHLCMIKTDEINAQLTASDAGYQLQFIDELDRSEARNGVPSNKGIANKIKNARMLLPRVFDYIRSGEWNLDNLKELRDECFTLGKKDRDGKNCVWKDVEFKAETSRYFDTPMAAHNYMAFDIILKGVLSIYAFMHALEERHCDLVTIYNSNPNLFGDTEVERHLDYLSGLSCVPTILSLQAEGNHLIKDGAFANSGELRTQNQMISDEAGSEQSMGKAEIRRNRKMAKVTGILYSPYLKQQGTMLTPFNRLSSVADYMMAGPRSYEEYIVSLMREDTLPANYAPSVELRTADIVAGKYHTLLYNKYMATSHKDASYYLYSVARGDESTYTQEWHIGNSLVPSVKLYESVQLEDGSSGVRETYCLYVPLADTFLLCPTTEEAAVAKKLLCRDLYDIQSMVSNSVFNGRYGVVIEPTYAEIPRYVYNQFISENRRDADAREAALDKSLGFECFLGFSNYGSPDSMARFNSIEVFPSYKGATRKYAEWMDVLSKVQVSFVEILHCMSSFALLAARGSQGWLTGEMCSQGITLLYSLLSGEFFEENLKWFFDILQTAMADGDVMKVDMRWETPQNRVNNVNFTPADLSVMDILLNSDRVGSPDNSLLDDIYWELREYKSIPQRFVQLYNLLNCKLTFLRVLRDSYGLIFSVMTQSFSSLTCELDSQFKIERTILSAKDSLGSGTLMDGVCATIDTLSSEAIVAFVNDSRQHNWQNFSLLCTDLIDYIDSCRTSIYKLSAYDITSVGEVTSKFQEWGEGFIVLGAYADPFVVDCLKEMRTRLRTDASGFFLTKNSYFRGRSGNSTYYVHYTGRMLEVQGTFVKPKNFDFTNESDRDQYMRIIKEGRGADAR